MEDKKAIGVLKELLEKELLSREEKEAVTTALGVLLLTVHTSESYLKQQKAKKQENSGS